MSTVGEVGERALIELIARRLTPMPGAPVPFPDDVAAVSLGGGRAAILKADMLVWATDIPPGMTHFQAGRKAAVMNFSDLASKGVRPLTLLASVGVPRSLLVEAFEELMLGLDAGAREYGAYLIGGDTNEAADVVVSGMAFGVAEEGRIMMRRGARPGDILATTGGFGRTAAAFKCLLEGYGAPPELLSVLKDSVYTPRARVEEGAILAETGAVSASTDSSDGLAISLHNLSESSGVGFRVEELPVAPEAVEFAELHGLEPSDLALYGGEEYELVFTVRPGGLDAARSSLRRLGCDLFAFGRATRELGIVYVEDGAERGIRPGGWEHFRR